MSQSVQSNANLETEICENPSRAVENSQTSVEPTILKNRNKVRQPMYSA